MKSLLFLVIILVSFTATTGYGVAEFAADTVKPVKKPALDSTVVDNDSSSHPQESDRALSFRIGGGLIDSTNTNMLAMTGSASSDSSMQNLYSAVPLRSSIDWNRFGISAGILSSTMVGIHFIQYNSWWKDQRGPFHIVDDQDYKANFDKLGHGFGAYYASHFFQEAYTWSGFDDAQATLLGAASACLWEFYVEIEDGFAHVWGFSPSDAVADILGSAFFVARNRIPFLQNFQYKWTYFPSQQLLENRPDIPGQGLNPIDDYGGQYYWGVANINGLLPKSWRGVVPDWLGLAFGIGGNHLDALTFEERKLAYYIALDYDLSKIIPESNIGILNFVRRALEYWHFPAPAVRLKPDPRFFILFPFRMSIG